MYFDSFDALVLISYRKSFKSLGKIFKSKMPNQQCKISQHKQQIAWKISHLAMDSSHKNHWTIYSTYYHLDKSASHQDNLLHVITAAYLHLSLPVHSTTRNVHCCYKFLLPHHMWSPWDNSVTCLSNTQPTTLQQFQSSISTQCRHKSYCCAII